MALGFAALDSARRPAAGHRFSAFVGTGFACAVAGWFGSLFTVAPGFASPIALAAGIALACMLVFGRSVLPAIALGSLAADLLLIVAHADPAALGPGPALQAAIAVAFAGVAVLQALLAATLVQRFLRGALTLDEPLDIARFYAAGLITSVVATSLAMAVLIVSGAMAASALPMTWATHWVGDLLGLLVAAPIVLTLIGQPRDAWVARRLPVGVTLILATTLLATALGWAVQRRDERTTTGFQSDAASASLALVARLQEPLHALEALRAVLTLSHEPSRADVNLATKRWLDFGGVQVMGWSERVRNAELSGYEARIRAEGSPGFHVVDRVESPLSFINGARSRADATASASPTEAMPIRFIEPYSSNAAAVGVNSLSTPAARTAIAAARRSGQPSATAGFRLAEAGAPGSRNGIAIYQAVYAGSPSTPAEREAATRGVAFVTLDMDAQWLGLAQQPASLQMCVVDRDAAPANRRLAGAKGCEDETAALQYVRPVVFAGRHWDATVFVRAADVEPGFNQSAWVFSLIGLLAISLLGAFTLTVTGRTRRVETAVRQRTAALEAEVAEREIAEAALRDSEQRFRNILDSVPIGVIYTNLAGDVIQANPRFCELTGYGETELLSLNKLDWTHPDDAVQEVELADQLVRGEIPMYRGNKRYLTKSGATVWVQSTVSLLRDSQNQPWRIVGVVEDITEHLRLEEAERAREAAESSNRAKSEFLSRMSHELRTPLNAMLGFAQLLELDQRHPLTDAQKPWVVQIQQAGWHLLEMINDVLDLSRIESGNVRLQTDTLNLTDLLEATVAMVESAAQSRGIAITHEFGAGTAALLGDPTRVKQILTNLLSNAVKYNREGGRIHVASRLSTPDTVEIAITDTGLGMTAQQMAELFQPFNRLGRERSSALEGTGIGLVISQRLAELMGGALKAKSVASQGSSFILTLPRAVDAQTVRSELDALESSPADYHRRVVHYVEDNETNVEVMRGILAQRPQVQMAVSITGLDGLAAIRAHRPDLILLDMHLPDIGGLDLLRHLKQDPDTTNIPIVVVSADALSQQISDALEAGADRYLTKPVSVGELLAILDDLLERIDTAFS